MAKKEESTTPRLTRSETNRVIAGVAGGLGEYFDIDPTIIRVIFILLTFFGGSGFLIYLILWIIMPSSSNQSNSNEHIKDNIDEVKEKAKSFASDVKFHSHRSDSRSWVGVCILILGLFFLLGNFGLLDFSIGKFWPIILIIIGFSVLTR